MPAVPPATLPRLNTGTFSLFSCHSTSFEIIVARLFRKVECAKSKKSPGDLNTVRPSGLYVLQTFDIFQRNKKSERRPDQNEVRISQVWWRVADSNRRPSACEKMSHSKIIERTGTFKAPVSLSLILSLNAVAVQHMESRRLGLCRIPDPFHEPKPEQCSKMIYR